MSVPDCQIEEDSWEVCDTHQRYKPCYICELEAAEYRMECVREDRDTD